MAKATRCSVDGCRKPGPYKIHLCPMHYSRLTRTGNKHMARSYGPIGSNVIAEPAERLFALVAKVGSCWEWQGARDARSGYGRMSRGRYAHRFSYELLVGPIPEGLQLDHLCRNRACVNPAHLEPVTGLENTRRSPIANGSKPHCPQGHPYDSVNTYAHRGRRYCRTCMTEHQRQYRARRAS